MSGGIVHKPWWQERGVRVPAMSGAALVVGLALAWSDVARIPGVLYWVALLLGASTFVPGALRRLVYFRQLGVGLLMTISATGAVILGFVEEAAAIAFLYSLAEALEDTAMDRARSGLRSLMTLVPTSVRVWRDGTMAQIPAKDLRAGDILVVRPGERVATDGMIRHGYSSLDTSAITGESIPVEVRPGDDVYAGSINNAGVLEIVATAPGTDNSLTQIVELVERSQSEKGTRARIADRLAKPLVPGVLVLAVLVAVIGSVVGDPERWITRGLVVLVAASPCALAISVPVTVVSAIGAASRFGVVLKSGAAFERLGGIRHVAFDKTGTLTRNAPGVAKIITAPEVSAGDALAWAAGLERHSTHPLASAITAAAPRLPDAHQVSETPGSGVSGVIDGATITVGSPRWHDAGPLREEVNNLEDRGMTVVVVHRDSIPVAVIGVRDELRPEVPEVVTHLKRQGMKLTMLTGDNARTANALAALAGIDDVLAELRPTEKAAAVSERSHHAPIAMIGDGINDAPALAAADIGIAMGTTGSDAAIESADVAFVGQDLRLIPQALTHARRGRQIITQNLAVSILSVVALVPLAVFGLLGLAAVVFVHEAVEVLVILNGLRASRARRAPLAELENGSAMTHISAS